MVLPSGVAVTGAFAHEGAARRLVHLLKYHGVAAPAGVLAGEMAPLLPPGAAALVPIPRATLRKLRYGADPAMALANRLSDQTGIPVLRSLVAPLWWRAHAGSSRDGRTPPRFRIASRPPPGSVLVDDVLTTGATIAAAAAVSGIGRAITATRAGRRTSL